MKFFVEFNDGFHASDDADVEADSPEEAVKEFLRESFAADEMEGWPDGEEIDPMLVCVWRGPGKSEEIGEFRVWPHCEPIPWHHLEEEAQQMLNAQGATHLIATTYLVSRVDDRSKPE